MKKLGKTGGGTSLSCTKISYLMECKIIEILASDHTCIQQVQTSLECSGKQCPPPLLRAVVKAGHAALVWW